MPETHGTPCPELKKLMEIVEKHEQRLGRGNIEFAVISTKLNIIMAILGRRRCRCLRVQGHIYNTIKEAISVANRPSSSEYHARTIGSCAGTCQSDFSH